MRSTEGRARTIILPDGRQLGYCDRGDPNGVPLFFFHGTPGSRYAGPPEAIAVAKGVRLIVPDRPGYGRSQPKPGRTILDWADDVVALADSLKIDEFAVAGYSCGAPYALACGYRLPGRVRRIGLVSGFAPLDAPGMKEHLGATRAVFELASADPRAVAKPPLPFTDPDSTFAAFEQVFPLPDKKTLADPFVRAAFRTELAAVFESGTDGVVSDFGLLTQAWGFAPEAVLTEVCLWQGDADVNVPVAMARYFERSLPNCQATFCPGEGHMLMFNHWDEIVDAIIAHSAQCY